MEKQVKFDLANCTLCPHECGINRFTHKGYCRVGVNPMVASVFLHRGEEPVISGQKGICNVFFAHCNLQCIFCQNHQISRNNTYSNKWLTKTGSIVDEIKRILDLGTNMLGFVSPTHQVAQMVEIIDALNKAGYNPIVVYNTNGYDKVETLKVLEGIVDVYLPDFKYHNNSLALRYSGVSDYFTVASKAIKEMHRQKGSTLILNNEGLAEFGLIVRNLVLPGHANDSIELLQFLAREISPKLYISLMSQYYPPPGLILPNELNQQVSYDDYKKVVVVMEKHGFRGWIQSIESSQLYQPDFESNTPFSE
ncbi:MAG TPA: radical SAM protein [Bacteroidales bacterium]|nr:radical SAM protein [Bacteroidales bacterium]